LIDAFVAGAALHATIVLYGYFLADQFVVTEGVRRAMSPVYASPNNLSLFLDRAWPILLAVTLLPRQMSSETAPLDIRRWLYGSGLVVVSIALYLTFSKGALLLGLPAGVSAMALFHLLRHRRHHWRRIMVITGGSLVALTLALMPLSRTDRFRTIFDFDQGSTGFFRLKLWQASLNMLNDYWPLGVGLNNFLYQYRTRYILPEAWQEPNLSHPHNIILDYGTRLGLGGVVILFWLQGAFWVNAWRLYHQLPEPFVLGLMGSMVVFLSHGLIDNAYFLVDLAFIFFLSSGLVQRLLEAGDNEWRTN
jgi:O-antigen ligase